MKGSDTGRRMGGDWERRREGAVRWRLPGDAAELCRWTVLRWDGGAGGPFRPRLRP